MPQPTQLYKQPAHFWPLLRLSTFDNLCAVVGEAQIFVYFRLATGLHPRAFEQIVYRTYMSTSPTPENELVYEINFLQVCLEIVQALQRRDACKGLGKLQESKIDEPDTGKLYRFQNEMRRRFDSIQVVIDQGTSKDLKEDLDGIPPLLPAHEEILNESLIKAEGSILRHFQWAESVLATEVPERYLEHEGLLAASSAISSLDECFSIVHGENAKVFNTTNSESYYPSLRARLPIFKDYENSFPPVQRKPITPTPTRSRFSIQRERNDTTQDLREWASRNSGLNTRVTASNDVVCHNHDVLRQAASRQKISAVEQPRSIGHVENEGYQSRGSREGSFYESSEGFGEHFKRRKVHRDTPPVITTKSVVDKGNDKK